MQKKEKRLVAPFKDLGLEDVALVGGKNASLAEMIAELSEKGINIPNGFALTADAFWHFIESNGLYQPLKNIFAKLEPDKISSLKKAGKAARNLILGGSFPEDLKQEMISAYSRLSQEYGDKNTDVAVRSSGTCEDMPDASFAGQFETFLNVRGEKALLYAAKKCLASLFNDRAIAYKHEKGFSQFEIALSVGVQKMIRSDLASSGIMFSLDSETGFRNAVLINSIYGIGEMIVKGLITPDEFYVFKPALKEGYKSIIIKNLGRKNKKYIYNIRGGLKQVPVPKEKQRQFSLKESEILTLARWAVAIEEHYSKKYGRWMPQDMEWAKDGKTGRLFITQSRPETIHSAKFENVYKEYELKTKKKPAVEGIAVGSRIGQGKARVIREIKEMAKFKKGEVLVAPMTDPDWLPVMRNANAIVTDEGSKVCHAAIVSRELGIPCIVGAKNATSILKDGQNLTVDCSKGSQGKVYLGEIPFKIRQYNLKDVPNPKVKIMVNIGAPEIAFQTSFLPSDGVGLAREEFIIAEKVRVHPLALYHFNSLKRKRDKEIRKVVKKIEEITEEHKDKKEHFIKELAEGVGQIAAAFWPKEVIVRFSDFKTNEYEGLVGGKLFERKEANPMLGFRGASRYINKAFQPAFKMECLALSRVRDVFGLKNISLMVPFCRTVEEGKAVVNLMKKFGLEKGKDGLRVYVMCEIPSNVVLAEKFLDIFDGMSIGSNDLTQLVLGIDRDNAGIAAIGNENNEAVKIMIKAVIQICKKQNKYCGICGQAPSDYPDFAAFLAKEGIESMSLNPDTVVKTILNVAKIG